MPEFVMEGRDECAREETPFVLGFLEGLFFTECSPAYLAAEWFSDECRKAQEEGQADGSLPGDVGYHDLHPDALTAIREDCEAWTAEHAALLAKAYAKGYTEEQAGRDYWYTRNGHGVGFWDRGILLDEDGLGEQLSEAAGRREAYVFFGDHVKHGDAPFVHVDL